MNLSLQGKMAVICGSTQGLGLAIAKELALLGADCTLIARNKVSLQQVIPELDKSRGQNHDFLVADFNETEQVRAIIEAHVQAHKVHILINNTGGPPPGPAFDAAEKDFVKAFNQHLVCNHILVKAVVPSMKREGYGRIINIISTSVRIPIKNLGVSNTIRAAVASWAKTLSNELAEFNITVNNLLPGYISTQRITHIVDNTAKKGNITPEEVEERMKAEVPMKRFGEPSELAALAAFLASPAASYITGTSIPVDGGKTGSI